MEIEINKLDEVRDIRKRRSELDQMEKDLLRPVADSFSQLEKMYGCFSAFPKRRRDNQYIVRKQFIFIAVWAYCPQALIGGRLPKRFRAELAKAMGLKSQQIISDELRDLLWYYNTYSDFRSETNLKYSNVMKYLQENEGDQTGITPEGQNG